MKAIQLLLNSELPPDLRDYTKDLDSKSIGALMADVARKYPDQYERISKVISDLGRKASYYQGETLTLSDNRPVIDRDKIFAEMDKEVGKAQKLHKNVKEFEKAKLEIWDRYNNRIQNETSRAALAAGNNLAYSVMSGARGKPPQLKMMISTPGLYTDAQDNVIPLFIRNSFAGGLRPAEYLAGTYGARKSVLCLHEDTLVRLPDGSAIPIKDIKIGQRVLGADKEGNTFPVNVLNIFNQGYKPVSKYIFNRGTFDKKHEVICTSEHKFLHADGCLHTLNLGCTLFGNYNLINIAADNWHKCYDIEVDHPDHLFVLDNGIISQNSTKRATAKGGDLSKQMVQSAAHIVVSEKDCGAANGLDLDVNDKSLKGRILARETNGIPAGTVLDKESLAQLRKKGAKTLIARSPLTCQSKEGICAKCLGVNGQGKLPSIGESVGITAASSIGEPITQMALNCLVENTLVKMADFSDRPIQLIEPGEFVLGADINGVTFPVRVTHKWNQGLQPVQEYTYNMGQSKQRLKLECTAAHPVLSNTKKSSCKEAALNKTLRKLPAGYLGKNTAAVLPTKYIDTDKQEEAFALLVGIILGDGIRCTEGAHKFSCADPMLITDTADYLEALGLRAIKCTRSFDWRFSMISDDLTAYRDARGQVVAGNRNPLKRKLEDLRILGKYAHEKEIPIEVLRDWDNKSVAALIAGYIATDGSVYKNKEGQMGVSFSSCSKQLLQGIKDLLFWRLSVPSASLTCTGRAGTGNRTHDMWAFTVTRISDIKNLFKVLPTIPGVKGARFNKLVQEANYSLNDTFYRCGRSQIVDLGLKQCWDISVDHPDELFVLANGLIVKNTKHQGGAAATGKRTFSGFDVINQFMQSPETFPDKSVLAKKDGQVTSIVEAPQGGFYVSVNNEPHYVSPGYPITVKVGDKLEAGDLLSEGLPDPGEVVELRGLGEGRRYYADKLKELLDDSGMEADRRNTELIARSALDHVQLSDTADDDGEFLPDDVVSYSYFSNRYTPPKNTSRQAVHKAAGTYLQSPVLHYTIGTKITPKIATHINDAGFKEVFSSPDAPNFKPHMVRLRAAAHNNTDWLASMHTSYLKKQLNESAVRGETTNIESNSHFAPRLAIGANFGDNIEQTGKF